MTNMIIDWNGNLVWADGSGRLAQMGTVPESSGHFSLTTKDFDFGQPSQRKKIYKVYIAYKRSSDAGELELLYAINGGSTFKVISTSFPAHSVMTTKSYRVDTLTDFETSDVYSMKLKIHNSTQTHTPSDFEINDMSIVFRVKPVN